MTIRSGWGDESAVPTMDMNRCNGCGLCLIVCKSTVLSMKGKVLSIEPERGLGCMGCGHCMLVCPTGCLTVEGRDMSPEDILDIPPRDERATPEQLENLLVARRSVREFRRDEVPREVVEHILLIASTAPMGIPPSDVEVLVFSGRKKVRAFNDDVMKMYDRALSMDNALMTSLMRLFYGREMTESMKTFIIPALRLMVESWKEGKDLSFYDAPLVLLFHQSPYADPADAHIAAAYAMIAAESLGLGTCMNGMVSPFLARDKKLMKKLGIPTGNKPSIVLIAGYSRIRFSMAVRRRFASVDWM